MKKLALAGLLLISGFSIPAFAQLSADDMMQAQASCKDHCTKKCFNVAKGSTQGVDQICSTACNTAIQNMSDQKQISQFYQANMYINSNKSPTPDCDNIWKQLGK